MGCYRRLRSSIPFSSRGAPIPLHALRQLAVPECCGNSDSQKKKKAELPSSSKENASPSVDFPVIAAICPLLPSG